VSLDFTDIFCGAGGSSIGLAEAGLELKLAANHWDLAIETHSANFRDAEHVCADMDHYDMRRLPRTQVLWASVICTESTPAGGRRKKRGPGHGYGQLALVEEAGHVSAAGWERTRATAYDVLRAVEVHRYDIVIIENVVEFATDWPLFDWWLEGWAKLGYEHHVICVNSAHVGGEDNPFAPQWRDRIYIWLSRDGIRVPDLEPRPLAWCFDCSEVVAARQTWKTTPLARRRIGKYRDQYVYTCPNSSRQHESLIVEPFVLPAAAAIDWTDLGTRIGDRKRTPKKPEGLAPATIARIRAGLELFAQPVTVAVGGNTYERPGSGYVRAWPVMDDAMNARNCTSGEAVAVPPFIALLRGGQTASGVDDPLSTVATSGAHHGLVLPVGGNNHRSAATGAGEPMRARMVRDTDALITHPFITMLRGPANAPTEIGEPLASVTTGRNHGLTVPPFLLKNYGGYCTPERNVMPVDGPVGAITAHDHHALVIPFRGKRSRPTTTGEPLHTVATRESAALVHAELDVADCLFRMLKPREHLRAQRFPDTYVVMGNQGEQTMQAGNAVSANVANWLGRAVAAVLG
jgi:DNA (cytosine-5)-methyltransferase 1